MAAPAARPPPPPPPPPPHAAGTHAAFSSRGRRRRASACYLPCTPHRQRSQPPRGRHASSALGSARAASAHSAWALIRSVVRGLVGVRRAANRAPPRQGACRDCRGGERRGWSPNLGGCRGALGRGEGPTPCKGVHAMRDESSNWGEEGRRTLHSRSRSRCKAPRPPQPPAVAKTPSSGDQSRWRGRRHCRRAPCRR